MLVPRFEALPCPSCQERATRKPTLYAYATAHYVHGCRIYITRRHYCVASSFDRTFETGKFRNVKDKARVTPCFIYVCLLPFRPCGHPCKSASQILKTIFTLQNIFSTFFALFYMCVDKQIYTKMEL